ncbi:MAG: TldD/PmbA family protein, partial [Nitrosopumilales archaeon]|nr:TldD/PmbA family protein [Nitrosopumilales archaeon]
MESNIEDFADEAISHALDLKCRYCDVRAEIITKEGLVIENGQIEHIVSMFDRGLGIRVLNDGVWGFFSISNPSSISEIIDATDGAVSSARYYTKKQKIRLASIPTIKDRIVFPIRKEPDIEELAKIGFDCDKIIHEKKRIIKSSVSIGYSKTKKYFASSEGSKITQEYADVVSELSATAHESGLTQSVDSTEGG